MQPLPGRAPEGLPPWQGTIALPRARRAVSPPAAPLFAPLKSRALLAGLAARRAPDGTPDLDRLAAQMATGTLPAQLPQALAWRIAGGLQVLVDEGPGMAPFQDDMAWLKQRLGGLMPADSIAWLRFEGTPLRGCRQSGRRGRHAWRPAHPGQAVLLVSELGLAPSDPLGPGASVREWLTFAQATKQSLLSLRTLVPWPLQRLPRALCDALHPITWDRSTTVGMVRRQVAKAAPSDGH